MPITLYVEIPVEEARKRLDEAKGMSVRLDERGDPHFFLNNDAFDHIVHSHSESGDSGWFWVDDS